MAATPSIDLFDTSLFQTKPTKKKKSCQKLIQNPPKNSVK
jgi:hypothetical protein